MSLKGENWEMMDAIKAPSASYTNFGMSVAIQSRIVNDKKQLRVITADEKYQSPNSNFKGVVFIYEYDFKNNKWLDPKEVYAPSNTQANYDLGSGVGIFGDTLVVGQVNWTPVNGRVCVYNYNTTTKKWVYQSAGQMPIVPMRGFEGSIYNNILLFSTNSGQVLAYDTDTGKQLLNVNSDASNASTNGDVVTIADSAFCSIFDWYRN